MKLYRPHVGDEPLQETCSLELLCARFEVMLAAEREEVDGSEVHGVPRLVDFLDRHLQSSLVSDSTLAS